jgi:hypothetical protein
MPRIRAVAGLDGPFRPVLGYLRRAAADAMGARAYHRSLRARSVRSSRITKIHFICPSPKRGKKRDARGGPCRFAHGDPLDPAPLSRWHEAEIGVRGA